MQLTKHTDYAFRILIYLAASDQELCKIQQLADRFDISKSHVMKIVNKLVNKGWVTSLRGKNGGIHLGIAAEEITLDKVVVLMEKTLNPANCTQPLCTLRSVCQLKDILLQAQEQYLSHLQQFTLADILDQDTVDVVRLM